MKSCERCEEYETMIDNERKSNSQLKKLIEQKENQNKPQTTTNKCTSCSKCDHSKQLLDIEKENCIQLKQQFQQQTKQTEEEKHAKQVFSTSKNNSFFSLDNSTKFRSLSIRINQSKNSSGIIEKRK